MVNRMTFLSLCDAYRGGERWDRHYLSIFSCVSY
jgi:hypothetical protein